MDKNYKAEVAEELVKFAKEQKIGVARAISRSRNTGRFDYLIGAYMKRARVGRETAWQRVVNHIERIKD